MAIYLETDPYGLPSLREHVQKHTACRFDSPLWQAPSWTEVANGYLDLTQWGPPPKEEVQALGSQVAKGHGLCSLGGLEFFSTT